MIFCCFSLIFEHLFLPLLLLLPLLQLLPLGLQQHLILLVLLLQLKYLILMLILLLIQLFLVNFLQALGGALGIRVLILHFEQIKLKFFEEFVDGVLVLAF